MKVLVADDHEYFRSGLISDLSNIIQNSTFVEAANAAEVLNILEENSDVAMAILDLYMPGSNQYELIAKVCRDYPGLLVVVMSASEDSKDMRAVFNCGVSGYIPKTAGGEIVLHAVQLIVAGGNYFPKEMLAKSLDNQPGSESITGIQKKVSLLTKRQKEVLELLLQGNANKKIAKNLELSESTVKIHVTAILRTLELESRTQVIAIVQTIKPRLSK